MNLLGPVNTYHMEASFLTRMGIISEGDLGGFEWPNYPLEVFFWGLAT